MIVLHDYRVRQRDHLLNIARAITEKLDLSEVLRRILEASASMLAGEIGVIALTDDHNHLKIQAAFGVASEHLWVFQDLLDELQEQGFDGERLNLRTRQIAKRLDIPLRQVIALPMSMHEEPLGLILVFRTFSGVALGDDRQILQSFADQAAIAVHNARLYSIVNNEKSRLSAILDHSADGIMILDKDRRIQRFNRALGSLTAWRPEMAMGRLDTEVIRWRARRPGLDLDEMLAQGCVENRTLYVEGEIERLDGLPLSAAITYAVICDNSGQVVNIIANVRDITQYRKAEQMKDTFISVISHELKTPVALIKGYAETLLREDARWDAETFHDALSVIQEEADRLTGLIENLLAASKLKAEGMRLSISDVRLDQLIQRSAERFQTQTELHHIYLDFPPNFPVIAGDETRLRQVFENLISNAIKYSPEGGDIVISGSYDDQQVKVSVTDHGVGIRGDLLDRIFERFYRVEDELSRSTQGTGLGLYLARAVIDAHGGQIGVESAPDKDSTFSIILPRN